MSVISAMHFPLATLEDTIALAGRMAAQARPGDVIALQGDLGTGKTEFARAFIRALVGLPLEVASPTFTLLQTYPSPQGDIWHYDLYRVEDPSALRELGLEEALQNIVLIEWPEKLGDYRMPIAAMLHFVLAADGSRSVDIESRRDWT